MEETGKIPGPVDANIRMLEIVREFVEAQYTAFQWFLETEHEIESTEGELFLRHLEDHIAAEKDMASVTEVEVEELIDADWLDIDLLEEADAVVAVCQFAGKCPFERVEGEAA